MKVPLLPRQCKTRPQHMAHSHSTLVTRRETPKMRVNQASLPNLKRARFQFVLFRRRQGSVCLSMVLSEFVARVPRCALHQRLWSSTLHPSPFLVVSAALASVVVFFAPTPEAYLSLAVEYDAALVVEARGSSSCGTRCSSTRGRPKFFSCKPKAKLQPR